MELAGRIEQTLEAALQRAVSPAAPPLLLSAVRHAVFPGGARVRPRICLAVAAACGDPTPTVSDATAAAIELLHCASLVHDDLPCFDNADVRRGRASVHSAFNEPLAVLAGDALIVMAFETIARAGAAAPQRLGALLQVITRGVGLPGGIVAGQAWESEPEPPLQQYHAMKTGALFVAATMGGAIAANADPQGWRALGERLGEAYQVADDLFDAVAEAEGGSPDKPRGQDNVHQRPSAVRTYGLRGAVDRLDALVQEAAASIPECLGADGLRDLVRMQARRLVPKQLARSAA
jgi:geranylgeranyl diphosphate synthase type II